MPKRCAILQSSYIPWKGYFDLINMVDEFILYDTVQYTRRDWRNRNKIKTPRGAQWLTIPVKTKGNFGAKIQEIEVEGPDWGGSHWGAICTNYAKAKHFGDYRAAFEQCYLRATDRYLSAINEKFIRLICNILGIETRITSASQYASEGDRNWRLINLCKQVGAEVYYSGPAAKSYMDVALFEQEGIEVVWMDYSGYPEYEQLFPPFDHHVSVLDLIFNQGADAPRYMKSFERCLAR
ncbi:MAG TPA: WbqC family protein [Candidatus Obscuribacterales bacterium]